MKKNLLILVILVIAAGAVYLLLPDSDTTISKEFQDFAIDNPQEVDSIFMAGKEKYVLLRKQSNGKWTVNNKFDARPEMVQLLLTKMSRLEARSPVSNAQRAHVIGRLVTDGIKVEVYAKGEKIKEYYVGDNTLTEDATYMFIKGDGSEPFEVHEPGFNGYLNIIYNINEHDWKTRILMEYEPEDIKSVVVEYFEPELRMESFKLERTPAGLQLTNLMNPNIQATNSNANAVNTYFNVFKTIYHAGYPPAMTQEKADSIFETTPWAVLKLTDVDGNVNKIAFHDKPVGKETKVQHDEQGVPMTKDTDLSFCFFNDDHELIGIDQYSYSRYLKGYSDFFKSVEQLQAEQQRTAIQ